MRNNLIPIPLDSFLEDGGVRLERDDGTVCLARANLFHFCNWLTNLVLLPIDPAILMNRSCGMHRERIYNRGAHAMEPTRDLVAGIFTAELPASMKRGHDSLEC